MSSTMLVVFVLALFIIFLLFRMVPDRSRLRGFGFVVFTRGCLGYYSSSYSSDRTICVQIRLDIGSGGYWRLCWFGFPATFFIWRVFVLDPSVGFVGE